MTEERKIHYIDVGDLSPAEALNLIDKVRVELGHTQLTKWQKVLYHIGLRCTL